MKAFRIEHESADARALQHVVEPLASYICAADRPAAVLRIVLSTLIREVEQTNRAARTRIAVLTQQPVTVPA